MIAKHRYFNFAVLILAVIIGATVITGCQKSGKTTEDHINDLYDKNPAVRKAAADALAETSSISGYGVLSDLVPYENDPDVGKAMYRALQAIEDNRSKLDRSKL